MSSAPFADSGAVMGRNPRMKNLTNWTFTALLDVGVRSASTAL